MPYANQASSYFLVVT